MTESNLPGRTDWETHQYLRAHGHRVAAAQAYHYLGRLIETDDNYPLPAGSEAIITAAATAMQAVHTARVASAEAYAAAIKAEAAKANARITGRSAA